MVTMKITRAVVPSLFTVLNMFSGFLSVVHASAGDFVSASWFIILAAGFDALDGIMARITKSSSQFGVEIDSLSDVISFGAAPAFLVYQMDLQRLDGLGILLSSLLMVFAGLRLARFNVQLVGFDKEHFVGLPTPASGISIASFTLLAWNQVSGLHPAASAVLPWLAAGLGLLMVSKVRYDTLPKFSRRGLKRNPWKFGMLGIAAVAVVATRGDALFPLLMLFVVAGIIRSLVGVVRRLLHLPSKYAQDESVESTQIDT
jgi:CDP-diacylglycerol--serine O-phosphatidyltransferase